MNIDPKDDPVHYDLEVSLEEIFSGCIKEEQIKRKIYSVNGLEIQDVCLSNTVSPGTPDGAQIPHLEAGDKHLNSIPADIIFTVRYKDHPLFDVHETDIYYTVFVSSHEAQYGLFLDIITLEHKILNLGWKGIKFGEETEIPNQGLPLLNNPMQRGNLHVKFDTCHTKIKGNHL